MVKLWFSRFLILGFIFLASNFAQADSFKSDEPKTRLAPLTLEGGSELTLISPDVWTPLADRALTVLSNTHAYYKKVLGEIPAFKSTVRLMPEEEFFQLTGAPSWTNAMYFRGEIIIPLALGQKIDLDNLYRSVKHEYTHAVVNSLSGGRCPGWLDEGLAQWAEGDENPALRPALNQWLTRNRPVPLGLLQGGFTKLDFEMVPPAYAQSLYAAKHIIHEFGFSSMRHYFDALREGDTKDSSFQRAFGQSERRFEQRLGGILNTSIGNKLASNHNHQLH